MFKVYSKENCRFCSEAKSLLQVRGEDFEVVDSFDVEQMKKETYHYTYPFIFKDNVFLGGFTELRKLLNGEDPLDF